VTGVQTCALPIYAARLADTIVANLPTIKLTDRQALLEMEDAVKRLERLHELMQAEI
jgi:ATP-dependent Lon protease